VKGDTLGSRAGTIRLGLDVGGWVGAGVSVAAGVRVGAGVSVATGACVGTGVAVAGSTFATGAEVGVLAGATG